MTQAAIIAALYAAITSIFIYTSFGTFNALQVRVSEALTLLPMLSPAAVPGLFVGCLLANLIGMGVGITSIIDVVIGPVVTLLAALLTRKLRKHPLLAALPPVLLNAIYVGWFLTYIVQLGTPFWVNVGWTALGQFAACYLFGFVLLWALRKLPQDTFAL